VILHLLGWVGCKHGARPAEGFGNDVRQCQSAIETLAVELTEPGIRLLPVPNERDRLKRGELLLDQLVSKHYALEEVSAGYEDLAAGRNARGVIEY